MRTLEGYACTDVKFDNMRRRILANQTASFLTLLNYQIDCSNQSVPTNNYNGLIKVLKLTYYIGRNELIDADSNYNKIINASGCIGFKDLIMSNIYVIPTLLNAY